MIAVNKGTPYDAWARPMPARYGFTSQAYDTQADAVQAVLSGRAYATFAGNTSIRYTAKQTPLFVADLALKDTRAPLGRSPVRKDDVALRDQLQDALDCMKKDGTLAKLYEKWFGPPEPDDLERMVDAGLRRAGHAGLRPDAAQAALLVTDARAVPIVEARGDP